MAVFSNLHEKEDDSDHQYTVALYKVIILFII